VRKQKKRLVFFVLQVPLKHYVNNNNCIATTLQPPPPPTTNNNTLTNAIDDGRSLIEEVKRLLRLHVRVFYSDECVMVLDTLLAEEKSSRDEDIAMLMQLPTKYVAMTLQLLVKERVCHSHSKEEASRHASNLKSTSVFYYVNYRDAIDVLRWRLYRLKTAAADALATGDDSYRCTTCNAHYGALDVARLISPRDHLFHCPHDDTVLVDSAGDSARAKLLEMRQQLNRLLKPLHDGVRALEGRTLPHVEWPFELAPQERGADRRRHAPRQGALRVQQESTAFPRSLYRFSPPTTCSSTRRLSAAAPAAPPTSSVCARCRRGCGHRHRSRSTSTCCASRCRR
jgi:transcription initiation factor IIE alpha subunit